MILSRMMQTYLQLFFEMMIIQEFGSKLDESLLSKTQIPSDDILESLHKLRIRVSEKLKTVLELYDLEIQSQLWCAVLSFSCLAPPRSRV